MRKPIASTSAGWESAKRRFAIRNQRRRWGRVATEWDDHGGPSLGRMVDAVVGLAKPEAGMVALDIGAGTGSVSLRLAPGVRRMIVVDVSPLMIEQLVRKAALCGCCSIEAQIHAIEDLDLPAGGIDVIVSNYALHHLRDRDKEELVRRMAVWLRPGGRAVIGDMMLGRGRSAEDRKIIAGKVRVLARKGPAGWWRVAKGAWRYLTRTQERPISAEAWCALFRRNGFVEIEARRIFAEGAVVLATKPTLATERAHRDTASAAEPMVVR